MGAIFGIQYKLSKNSWSHLQSNSVNIGLNAGFDASKTAGAKINASINWNRTEYEMFASSFAEKRIFSRGAPPPADYLATTWMANTIENPAPLQMELISLDRLPYGSLISSNVKTNLKRALDEYCTNLVKEGKLSTCSPLPEDPPLPKVRKWTWWATDREYMGRDFPALQCPVNQYVKKMQWRGDNHNGLTDVRYLSYYL